LSAQFLGGMFELESFGQANRQEDEVDVMLNIFIDDDVFSRIHQEKVEVFEEEAVEGFQITIEKRFIYPQMSHEDRQRLLVRWGLTPNHRRHALRSDFYSPIENAGRGLGQSFGQEP
jgi:hypothetical protein